MEPIRKCSSKKVTTIKRIFCQYNILIFLSFSDIVSPEGVAVDWISRRIYWTDSGKDTIEVASLDDGKLRAVIIKSDLVNPRGITVDPHQKYVLHSFTTK